MTERRDNDYVLGEVDPDSPVMRLLHEEPAPIGERCDEVLAINATGVWRCQRPRGHDGACVAVGSVELDMGEEE